MKTKMGRAYRGCLSALVSAVLVVGCGGGGGSSPQSDVQAQATSASCALPVQMTQLHNYMLDRYYFYDRMPNPNQSQYSDIWRYFHDLLYTVSDRTVASDHWSYVSDKTAYDDFFRDATELGFGLQTSTPDDVPNANLPIQNVDPASPAFAAGLRRGQVIVNINGMPAAGMDLNQFYSAMYAQSSGQLLSLDVLASGVLKHVEVYAGAYKLTLVQGGSILTTPMGTQAGYVRLDAFINTAWPDLGNALDGFNTVDNLIIDLRFDGGGSLDLAAHLVNEIVGQGHDGQVMAQVRFNSKHSAENWNVPFQSTASKGWHNVYVLTGPDTCSASEFVINALKPFVNVVQIGKTSCGKPFGFMPVTMPAPCDQQVFSAENFELFNGNGEGRYYAGMTPTCDAADDLSHEPGTIQEALTGAALSYIDTGRCNTPSGAMMVAQSLRSVAIQGAIHHAHAGLRNSMWLKPAR